MTDPVKILAVDDEADFETLLRQRFRRRIRDGEFTLLYAQHGEEALSVLDSNPDVDLMLVDINMPVMDGLKLISLIRGEPNLASMPICVITTEGAGMDPAASMPAGTHAGDVVGARRRDCRRFGTPTDSRGCSDDR